MSKNAILIMSYAPDIFRENLLRDLVNKVKLLDLDIILVSHTHQSNDIVNLVDYYLYDKENLLIPLHETENFDLFSLYNINVQTQLNICNLTNHGVAALKMLHSGLSLAKSLGYEKIIQIEFDTKIYNEKYILDLLDRLNNYDCLFFSDDSTFADLQINGYNLNSYSFEELKYDESYLKEKISFGENFGMAEKVFLEMLLTSKKYLICDRGERDLHMTIDITNKTFKKNKYIVTPIFNNNNNKVGLFISNKSGSDIFVNTIINNEFSHNVPIANNNWYYHDLCEFNDLKNILIIVDNEKLHNYDFENDKLKNVILRHKSFITFN
jgi:hypothetical protein